MKHLSRFVFLFALMCLLVNFPIVGLLQESMIGQPLNVMAYFFMCWLLFVYVLYKYCNYWTKTNVTNKDE